ncbi:hypothetical protein T310_5138 [Rasamsonia emersonii CBS 393.64]|uniref:Uncharacterized protein n=1 Tax=Rasamsonia emersonii (strain ATCC 16479 / CBS 393.64 / IMI 116815) TaxID=1408163 RepID=A0A0F4YRZ4_RASE3|nr:hypothetical protein T310_5138 [Rasamsonia emersonii CBS 393.64]KKA20855.1 hypothetical protein T310_5138 [Rasamsonia emersonii CBS 393.64]
MYPVSDCVPSLFFPTRTEYISECMDIISGIDFELDVHLFFFLLSSGSVESSTNYYTEYSLYRLYSTLYMCFYSSSLTACSLPKVQKALSELKSTASEVSKDLHMTEHSTWTGDCVNYDDELRTLLRHNHNNDDDLPT